MSRRSLPDKIVAIDEALTAVPHAFGGALALAYYAEPRATIDIDLNVFVAVEDHEAVFAPLCELGVTVDATDTIERDGQVRLWWDATPLDVFFAYDRFHVTAGAASRHVPFADTTIPILAAEHLVVCKVVFDRPKDWVDIDAMVALGAAIDTGEVLRWVGRIIGDDDTRYGRVAAVLSARSGPGAADARASREATSSARPADP